MARQTEMPMNMDLVDIPGTSLKVSPIALGTWAIGGWMWGGTDEAEAIRTIHEAIDRGITLIDTAPVYGFGHSEEIVGKALAEGGRRKRVTIATKVGLDWKDGQPFRNASRTRIHKEIEDSLRRLRTDVIDVYQVHWPDPKLPIEETAAAMADLQRAGKIQIRPFLNHKMSGGKPTFLTLRSLDLNRETRSPTSYPPRPPLLSSVQSLRRFLPAPAGPAPVSLHS